MTAVKYYCFEYIGSTNNNKVKYQDIEIDNGIEMSDENWKK